VSSAPPDDDQVTAKQGKAPHRVRQDDSEAMLRTAQPSQAECTRFHCIDNTHKSYLSLI